MTCLLLHSSGYSSVFLGTAGSADRLSCFKVYNKAFPLQQRHWLNIFRECCILSRLQEERVDGIVQLLSVADTAKHFSLQFKPCLGGTLYQSLQRRECCTEEELCAKVVAPLLHVLKHLHSRGIIHRDIKPENIFFEADGKLVLGDFGLAIDSTKDKACSRVGTQDYMAPEVLAQPSADTVALRNMPTSLLTSYSTAVDIWAIGTLVQEALTGKVPFYHPEASVMALKAQFAAADRLPACISPECQAFVDAALHKQAGKRPAAAELLKHPWVLKHAAAAAAVAAARVKAKFLAELHIDRSIAGSAHTSPVAPAASSSLAISSAAAAAAAGARRAARADKVAAAAGGLKSQRPIRGAAGARACADARSGSDSSQASTASSCSEKAPAGESCSDSSSCYSRLRALNSTHAGAPLHGNAQQLQGPTVGLDAAEGSCACIVPKVSFDCAALRAEQSQQQQGRQGTSAWMPALTAAAAADSCSVRAQQQLRKHHHLRASSPGLMNAVEPDRKVKLAAGAAGGAPSTTDSNAPVVQQLHLLAALSEPVLTSDIPLLPSDSTASKRVGDTGGSGCCCCSSPVRSSQSGACSATAAAAAAASRAHSHSWRHAPASATAAAGSAAGASACGGSDCMACASGCADTAVLSAPTHVGYQDGVLPAGLSPASSLGTLAAPDNMRRVVQLRSSRGCTGAATSALVIPSAGADRATAQQKPPLLKPGSATVPAQGAAGASNPKLPPFSPPKPGAGVLMQRLRSFAHSSKDRGSSGSSSALLRRYSFDHTASAAIPAASRDSSQPAAVVGQPASAVLTDASASSPPRSSRVRSAAAAGLSSPLAALSKLGVFLSPPSASVTTAAHGHSSSCCTAPDFKGAAGGGTSKHKAGGHAVQPTRGCEGGPAALLVGLAGTAGVEAAAAGHEVACWTGQSGPHGAASASQPVHGCRRTKGVCMKVLNQVLRHQQHA